MREGRIPAGIRPSTRPGQGARNSPRTSFRASVVEGWVQMPSRSADAVTLLRMARATRLITSYASTLKIVAPSTSSVVGSTSTLIRPWVSPRVFGRGIAAMFATGLAATR